MAFAKSETLLRIQRVAENWPAMECKKAYLWLFILHHQPPTSPLSTHPMPLHPPVIDTSLELLKGIRSEGEQDRLHVKYAV